jgi:hypothetical protein
MSGERKEEKEEGTSIKLILYGFMEGIFLLALLLFLLCVHDAVKHIEPKSSRNLY